MGHYFLVRRSSYVNRDFMKSSPMFVVSGSQRYSEGSSVEFGASIPVSLFTFRGVAGVRRSSLKLCSWERTCFKPIDMVILIYIHIGTSTATRVDSPTSRLGKGGPALF